jgi:hypothetical protein
MCAIVFRRLSPHYLEKRTSLTLSGRTHHAIVLTGARAARAARRKRAPGFEQLLLRWIMPQKSVDPIEISFNEQLWLANCAATWAHSRRGLFDYSSSGLEMLIRFTTQNVTAYGNILKQFLRFDHQLCWQNYCLSSFFYSVSYIAIFCLSQNQITCIFDSSLRSCNFRMWFSHF